MPQQKHAVIACRDCALRRNDVFRQFSEDELDFVSGFKAGELYVEPGATLLAEANDSVHLYTIYEGWAFRYKSLPDGRRQVLNFMMPGDLVGLQAAMFDKTEHSVEALTPMRLCVFIKDKLWDLYQRFPSLGFDVTWLAAREERMLDEHLLSVGRRTALERSAYLFTWLYERARRLGVTNNMHLDLPITQQHVADALGLSLVHTNKTLRQLERQGVLKMARGKLVLKDLETLAAIAKYEFNDGSQRPFL